MKTRWLTAFAGVVTAVVVVSLAMGFAHPDGSVGDKPTASASTTATATETPTATATPPPATAADTPTAALAPAAVSELWAGRPAKAKLAGDKVDWCPAVRITGQADAVRVFGAKAVDAAACRAVKFVFEQRYSRLSVPRKSYKSSNFDFVLPALSSSTASGVYRPRVNAFVANPGSGAVRDALGLVLLRGIGTQDGHTAAGQGRVYYGKAYTTDGYRDRSAWINPTWSKVAISLDWSRSQPRIVASFDATASMPVFNTAQKRDDMLTIATKATYHLRHGGGTKWSIGGWTVTTNTRGFAALDVK